jgi:hypothetical protein
MVRPLERRQQCPLVRRKNGPRLKAGVTVENVERSERPYPRSNPCSTFTVLTPSASTA